mmetsp:Transcript_10817/g.36403  ORF Transcript_10817/g.36403 Transcript_10817/m.36403 type:complete len:104 (+) Transcript_10817:638-949(+)
MVCFYCVNTEAKKLQIICFLLLGYLQINLPSMIRYELRIQEVEIIIDIIVFHLHSELSYDTISQQVCVGINEPYPLSPCTTNLISYLFLPSIDEICTVVGIVA